MWSVISSVLVGVSVKSDYLIDVVAWDGWDTPYECSQVGHSGNRLAGLWVDWGKGHCISLCAYYLDGHLWHLSLLSHLLTNVIQLGMWAGSTFKKA